MQMLKTPQIRPSIQVHGGALSDSATSALNQMQAQEQAFLSAGGYDVPREPEKHTVGPTAPAPGTRAIDLGTSPDAVERFAAATQRRELLPARTREEGLRPRTNMESASEAVRDYQTQPGRPVDLGQEIDIASRAASVATGASVQRVADIATGREKGSSRHYHRAHADGLRPERGSAGCATRSHQLAVHDHRQRPG